jgi:hypothetical protein
MISLGREPQESSPKKFFSRGAATDDRPRGLRLTPQSKICRPSGAICLFVVPTLGLTPQAMNLSRLRRSVQPSALHPRFLGRLRRKTLSSYFEEISDHFTPANHQLKSCTIHRP